MKQFIKDYFSFNRKERNGILALLGIIIILILYLNLSEYFVTTEKVDFSGFEKEINEFLAAQKEFLHTDSNKFNSTEPRELKLFNFNPNNLPAGKWKQLGLNDRVIKTIKNYETKGGKFYKKEDLKKIYGLTHKQYDLLAPYIQMSDRPEKNNSTFYLRTQDNQGIIEINSADTTQLKKLKGIGTVYASRIIKYRNLLGGFSKKEQLLEVYGIDSLLYQQISKHIKVDSSKVKKININFCSGCSPPRK